MADLDELNSSISTKLVGADSSGLETNFVNATVNGLKVDGSAVTQPISAVSLPLPTGTQPSFSEFSISATGTTNYDTNISGYATLIVTATGTWTGALEWYGSVNGTTYVNLSAMNVLDFSGEGQTFISTNSTVRLDISGFKFFRVRAVAVTGTASVVIGAAKAQSMLSQIQSSIFIANPSIPVTTSPSSSTASAPATATATTTSSSIVSLNANRKGLVITNLSATRVFISFGANPAVANRGIMLANGGSFVMDSFTFTTAAVNAIVASGTTTLAIQEYT